MSKLNNHSSDAEHMTGSGATPYLVFACARCGRLILSGAQCMRCCEARPVVRRRRQRKVTR